MSEQELQDRLEQAEEILGEVRSLFQEAKRKQTQPAGYKRLAVECQELLPVIEHYFEHEVK